MEIPHSAPDVSPFSVDVKGFLLLLDGKLKFPSFVVVKYESVIAVDVISSKVVNNSDELD